MSFDSVFNLSDLDGSNGFVINGIAAADYSGFSVSNAGDINGDGIDDLIIGAPKDMRSGKDEAGESYVVFGGQDFSSGSLNLADLNGGNGFVIKGVSIGDESGTSVSNAGDINGDGIDDLIIGATDVRDPVYFRGSEGYVVFGGQDFSSGQLNLVDLDGSNGFVISSRDGLNSFGDFVSDLGDINGDGIDDFVIDASDKSYVVFGGQDFSSGSFELTDLDGGNGFVFEGNFRSLGDVNGDGIADIAISIDGTEAVVFGGQDLSSGNFNLADLDGDNGFVIKATDQFSNGPLQNAGDINGDGFDDLVLSGIYDSSPYAEGPDDGESYVIFGRQNFDSASFDLADLDGSNGFAVNGLRPADFTPRGRNAGDINGDGFDDLIIGVYRAYPNSSGDGESYIIFGGQDFSSGSLNVADLDGNNGFVLTDEFNASGYSVSHAGDINGDGIDDIVIGAPSDFPNGITYAGRTYVAFGRKDELVTTAIDFDNPLAAGTRVSDQFEGVTISGSGFGAMIFDSGNPSGGDFDLAGDFGNILILSEDGNSADPDDNVAGGTFRFDFDGLTDIASIGLLDVEQSGGSVALYDSNGGVLAELNIPTTENNGFQTLDIGVDGVSRMDIILRGSGAITEVAFASSGDALDFDNPLAAGAQVSDQFEGVTISGTGFGAMIFDSGNPTGGDFDLAGDFGNILILSEDGDSTDPDDNARGGTLSFDFDELVGVVSVGLLDIEQSGGAVVLYGDSNTVLETVDILATGDNIAQTLDIGVDGVARMDIILAGSGAITDVALSPFGDDLGAAAAASLLAVEV